ncbi:MAG: B12-binding domain-containing radical SAM protein [Proteobacteria bacterium]|nr:B12-binding domain-containing radical SAM protein [Pseudomonadota bacterium]
MSEPRQVLLINPTITSKRHARFPLAVLSLSAALTGRYRPIILDGNIDRNFVATAVNRVGSGGIAAVGVTVMGGPQLVSAIAVSRAIRAQAPEVPIVWGGAFPTVCPEATVNSPYVDYAVRSQGEETFLELLDAITAGGSDAPTGVRGLSWRSGDCAVHNPERQFSAVALDRTLPYQTLENPQQYLTHTYLGSRTAGYQAALGCRFRCTFCGVATMYRGRMALPTAARLEQDLGFLQRQLGVNGIQFYDHNFFDREVDMAPLLEVLAKFQLPWWCFARSDALANLSEASWKLVRKSRLRMTYIGAESPSDWLLHDIRKGTRADQTFAAIEQCRRYGVVPELSFMLAPPQDPEGETERTFEFIRLIKRFHPPTEVMIYIYTPLPTRRDNTNAAAARMADTLRDGSGAPVAFPRTADEWAQPSWVRYWCHKDAPWLSERLRRRIVDFTTVLGCRFPTIMDVRAPRWGKAALRGLAAWRYRYGRYGNPWELRASSRLIRQWDPRVLSL